MSYMYFSYDFFFKKEGGGDKLATIRCSSPLEESYRIIYLPYWLYVSYYLLKRYDIAKRLSKVLMQSIKFAECNRFLRIFDVCW